jgi:hypothetical protein
MDSYNGNEYIELGTKDPDVIGKDKSGECVTVDYLIIANDSTKVKRLSWCSLCF